MGCMVVFAAADLHAQTPQDLGGDDINALLEEVVVTARHQAESAQRVPIALTSISATQLSDTRTVNLMDLAPLVPSMQLIQFNPRNTNLTIRGLGSNVAIASDVRPANLQLPFADLNDIEAIADLIDELARPLPP